MSDLILDLFFLSMLFQGALRKWVAPGLSLEIELFRDVLPALALIISYQQADIHRQLSRFTGLAATFFWAYASVAVFEACSPSLPVFVVLVGIRTHFAYVPLAFLMPTYLKSWPHGLRKFRQLLILAVPIFLLSFFQTTQPAGSIWNQYADPEMFVATFGGGSDTARATGTFAYMTEFANFAEICAIITLFLILTVDKKIIGRLWNAGILIMAFGAMMASGCRQPVAVFGAQVLGIAVLGWRVRAIPIRYLFPFFAFTLLALAVSVFVLDRQADDFLLRVQANDDIGTRADLAFFEWLDVMARYPLGVGLGMGHQAFYMLTSAIGPPNTWEVELSRLAFELGLGVVIYIAFKITLIGQLLARMKASRTRAGRTTLVMCAVTLIPLLIIGSVYWPLTNAVFWAFVGIGAWVVELEAAALLALRTAPPILGGTDRAARPNRLVGEGVW